LAERNKTAVSNDTQKRKNGSRYLHALALSAEGLEREAQIEWLRLAQEELHEIEMLLASRSGRYGLKKEEMKPQIAATLASIADILGAKNKDTVRGVVGSFLDNSK